MKKIFFILFVISLLVFPSIKVKAQQETCPEGGDWVKVDGLTGLTYEYTAPEGYVVSQSCYKAATSVVYQSYIPPTSPITITSEVFNSPGGETCTAPGVPVEGCSLQDLSHASFYLVLEIIDPTEEPTEDPTEDPTEEPTSTPTPVIVPEVSTGGGGIVLLVTGVALLSASLISRKRKS
ncbi:MAG: hypothetical protein PHE21_02155 [Candidatus Dojkabacteria bacterium]|nr:hypothetical protein [Candidatus Dojkabacteria bacterium]